MFHVKQFTKNLIDKPFHELFFYVFLFFIPIQTRILYKPEQAYIDWYFNYHLAIFFYLTDIILIACLVSWMLDRHWQIVSGKRLFWLILAFFLLILLSLFHVKRLDFGCYQAFKWAEVLLLILYVSETFKEKASYILAAWTLFISSIVQSIISLVQFHVQHSLGLNFLGEYIAPLGTPGLATIQTSAGKVIRAYGTFPHPNILGAFLVFGLILGFFLVSRGTKTNKIFVLLGLYITILGLFVSFSRLAWLATGLAIISFLLYYMMKQRRKLAIAVLIPILVSCATIMIFAPQTLKARVSDTNSTSVTDRYFFNNLGLDLIRRFPALGAGVGNYVPALEATKQLEAWQYQPAHNIFIFFAAEFGFIGLGLFILILFEIFMELKNVPRETLTFTFALIGTLFLIMGQFDHYFVTIQQGRLMFFTILGMLAAMPNMKASEKYYSSSVDPLAGRSEKS